MRDLEIFDCEQNSPEWLQARLGLPTASRFKDILAKGEGKTRRTYMLTLAGEILTGKPSEGYTNGHMERGHEMEPEARNLYAFTRDVEMVRVGFRKRGTMGCSPDSFVNGDGGFEAKTALPHILIDRLLRNDMPPEHRAQIQGTLMITGREWWDIGIYWPDLPMPVIRVTPDREYQSNLMGEIDRFNDELSAVVDQVRAYGK